jgi:NADH-quinone oxidoreductase subunit E
MTSHEKLENIMSHYEGVAADLIPVLQDIQDEFNYLPKNEMKIVAARLQVPLTRVYSVATFFKMFSLEPRGKHLIRVCLGTACHLRGGQRLVGCLGSCAQAPLMMIDNKYFGQMAVDKVPKILKPYKS